MTINLHNGAQGLINKAIHHNILMKNEFKSKIYKWKNAHPSPGNVK